MKYKEGRNGARRYMAEELYVENTGYPYLTSCSGDFLYSVRGFSKCMQKKNNKTQQKKYYRYPDTVSVRKHIKTE